MKKVHCDFCGAVMDSKNGTEGIFNVRGTDKVFKFKVSIACPVEGGERVRYSNCDCCLVCLLEMGDELRCAE